MRRGGSWGPRVAVVTGAAGGLGAACTRLLAERGHQVLAIDVRERELADVAEDAAARSQAADDAGVRVVPFGADLRSPGQCEHVIPRAIEQFGRVDVLVNSAAVLSRVELPELTVERFDEVMHTNTLAPLLLARAAMADMRRRRWGRVINVSASTAYDGGVKVSSLLYDLSKGAINVLTKMLAKHGAEHGILVNTVAPGPMATGMFVVESHEILERHVATIPLRRIADPLEVAHAVVWLAGEESSFITGATLDVNGGRVMR